jgi:hypothetical protein
MQDRVGLWDESFCEDDTRDSETRATNPNKEHPQNESLKNASYRPKGELNVSQGNAKGRGSPFSKNKSA